MDTSPTQPIESSENALTTSGRARRFFLLPLSEIIIIVVASLVLLLLSNVAILYQLTTGSESLAQYHLDALFAEKFPLIDQLLGSPFAGKLTQLLFWAFIGSVVYMIVWLIRNYSLRTFEDIEASHFVGTSGKGLNSAWAHHIFFGCTLFFGVIYSIVGLYVVLPLVSEMFARSLKDPGNPGLYIWVIASVLILSVLLYGWVIVWRLLRNSWRVYFTASEE